MDLYFTKQLLSILNRDSFSMFSYELWKLLDCSDDFKYQKIYPITEIGDNTYEQHFWERENSSGIYDLQGYNALIPFFQPIELFDNINTINFFDNEFIGKLNKYKEITDERVSGWQFWTDGNYIMPNIYFVTNFEGIEKEYYLNNILPKFECLLEKIGLSANAAVGSCDSFFEMNRVNSITAFNNFIIKNKKDISITFTKGEFKVESFYADKYLTKGLLQRTGTPCESIYIDNKAEDKSEILKEFETLINKKTTEQELEFFLTKYYKDIFGEKYDRIETQVWLRFPELDITNKDRRFDVFLRNCIERDWELFELKRIKKLTCTYRDIPVFKNEIYQAIQQINNYDKILSQDKVKQSFAREGIEYCYPEYHLVIGKKPDLTNEQWRWLKVSNENKLKIVTYDDLLTEMKLRYNLHNNLGI